MNKNILTEKYLVSSFLIVLFSVLLLLPTTATAQRGNKATKTQSTTLKKTSASTGKVCVNAGIIHGSGEVALENYTGSPLKTIQFCVISTSMNNLKSVLPGSTVANKKIWSCHHFIAHGIPDAFGKRSDTVRVVIFGNGWAEFPAGTSLKLLTLNYEQPAISGTSADTVSFKITGVVGALSPRKTGIVEAASVDAGPETSINLWK